ncbi:hypothetical protein [Bradyrhizobium sp. HKCCYLRH3097]|uniref:hypothetical protein n=1 Tax=Bradyrhizobium sp. HKCCYLRH3097 TaxID=3420752 RepID=UPI003EBB0F3F
MVALYTAGTMRWTLCIGSFAFKFARSDRGRAANQREYIEWDRATPIRREMLCPIIWAAPYGLFNVMRRAVPLTPEDQQKRLDSGDFPDWDYMPGGPKEPFEYKESDWGYLNGRLVSLDYAGWDRDE